MCKIKSFYTIDEFSKRINVSQGTLRNWDKRGLLVPHHLTKGGHRVYSELQAVHYLESKSFPSDNEANEIQKSLIFDLKNGHILSVHSLSDLTDTNISELIDALSDELYKRLSEK